MPFVLNAAGYDVIIALSATSGVVMVCVSWTTADDPTLRRRVQRRGPVALRLGILRFEKATAGPALRAAGGRPSAQSRGGRELNRAGVHVGRGLRGRFAPTFWRLARGQGFHRWRRAGGAGTLWSRVRHVPIRENR
jgi:hypothetical protein